MSAITITITVELPEGATAVVAAGPAARPVAVTTAPSAQPVHTSLESESEWVCPNHGVARTVPAGVSKKTGKAYQAFRVCAEAGCDLKE